MPVNGYKKREIRKFSYSISRRQSSKKYKIILFLYFYFIIFYFYFFILFHYYFIIFITQMQLHLHRLPDSYIAI